MRCGQTVGGIEEGVLHRMCRVVVHHQCLVRRLVCHLVTVTELVFALRGLSRWCEEFVGLRHVVSMDWKVVHVELCRLPHHQV